MNHKHYRRMLSDSFAEESSLNNNFKSEQKKEDAFSDNAKAFWSQPNRPFGKEELEKMSKGFAEIYELLAKAKLKK